PDLSDELRKKVIDSIRGVLSFHEDVITTGTWDQSAARSAAESARSASAQAEASAAWAAESAAGSAGAADSAAASAWAAAYKKYAAELINLLKLQGVN